MIKQLAIFFIFILFVSYTNLVWAQDDDMGDLESLEQELDALESGKDIQVEAPAEQLSDGIAEDAANGGFEEESLEGLEDNLLDGNEAVSEDIEDLADEDIQDEFTDEFAEDETLSEETLPDETLPKAESAAENETPGIEEEPVEENFSDEFAEESDFAPAAEEKAQAPEDVQQPVEDTGFEEAPQISDQEIAPPPAEFVEDVVEPQVSEEQVVPTNESIATLEDTPDFNKEKAIARAYRYLPKNPMATEEWMQVVGARATEEYEVAVGDSLWEISVTLFGNGYFWPKLWQLNADITNPHRIQPGYKLLFVEGDLENAPEIKSGTNIIAESKEKAEPGEVNEESVESDGPETEFVAQEEVKEQIDPRKLLPELPPPSASTPTLEKIPPSLGAWHSQEVADKDVKSIRSQQRRIFSRQMYFVPFVFKQQLPEFSGEVIEVEAGSDTAQLYQYIFVKLTSGGVGDIFSTYLPASEALEYKGKEYGFPLEVQGQIKIIETVDADKSYYKALVTKLISPVSVGSKLLRKPLLKTRWNLSGEYSDAPAKIVGGQFDRTRKVLGLGSVVYLDKGSQDGVNVGSLQSIIQNQLARNPKSKVGDNTKEVGTLKIVDVDSNRSTGVVVAANSSIFLGDRTGKLARLFIPGESDPGSLESENLDAVENFSDEELEEEFDEDLDSEDF